MPNQVISINIKITLALFTVFATVLITYGKQSQQLVDVKERMVRLEDKVDMLVAQRALSKNE